MNIGLVSPYADIFSFGIRTLSACLKNENHNVKIIFMPSDFWVKYEDRVLEDAVELLKDVDLIGVSLMTNYFENSVQITHRLKRDLEIPVVWGGVHPTLRPEECLNYADIVCVGEAEETICELARKMGDGKDYRNVEGICLKENGKIVPYGIRPLIKDLDSVPFQDYDSENHYVINENGTFKMSEGLLKKYSRGNYITLATRGCPFGCSYCCNNFYNRMYAGQKIVRKRSIGNVIKELKHVKNDLPDIQCIYFDDDAFFLYSTEQFKEFCGEYKKNIKLPLVVTGVTPSTLTREKLSLLVDAGLSFIRMGIQTGSARMRKLYKRNHSSQQIEDSARIMNEFKDRIGAPQYDIILDNPWETDEDIVETLMFLTKLPTPYRIKIYSLTFYPKTELYEKAKREGMIEDDLRDVYRKYYNGPKPTYLNKLFFLLNGSMGKISTRTMYLLTNRRLRRLRLSGLLYRVLVLRYMYPLRLLSEASKDIKRGDYFRMARWFRKLNPFAGRG
jgi:anaerobic magnesium-protoporphyrin IX monomethyl ester cyclase